MNLPTGENRLLELAGRPDQPVSLAHHAARYGALPLRGYRGRHGPVPLADLAERAALRGRGGAGFPLATKLRAVASARRRPAFVVANGAEGEPASRKDRTLLTRVPHLVLDGAVLAAEAIGAQTVHLCVHNGSAARSARAAVGERARRAEDPVPIEVHEVPDRYVSSQETALINYLNGRSALPSAVPPLPVERGVRGKPTLVSNVETLAQLALLARYGADWYARVGTPAAPGTTLITLTGGVRFPGVVEVAYGSALREVLARAGAADLQAVLVGGYFGSWLSAERASSLRLEPDALRAAGASLGAGVLIPLPHGICGLTETLEIASWLAAQNAGQCGPCFNGLPALAATLRAVIGGRGGKAGLTRLRELCGLVEGRGACRHPDGTARLVRSALDVFEADLSAHLAGAPCRAMSRPA